MCELPDAVPSEPSLVEPRSALRSYQELRPRAVRVTIPVLGNDGPCSTFWFPPAVFSVENAVVSTSDKTFRCSVGLGCPCACVAELLNMACFFYKKENIICVNFVLRAGFNVKSMR